LVRELANDAALRGKVIPLAFHVDYWDRLGWRDPFSSPDWSHRQAFYVRAMGLPSGYTPQMVVNGARQFVGSNAHALDAALAEESRQAPFGSVRVSVSRDAALRVSVNANVTRTAPTDVMLVVYENGTSTKVARGENAGEMLASERVVRKLERVATAGHAGKLDIALDPAWKASGAVAFAQRADRKIVGATLLPR